LILVAAVSLLWAGVARPQSTTVTLTPNLNDVRILSGGVNTSYYLQDICSVYDNPGNIQHSLLQFNLDFLPSNQTITFAGLTMYRDSQIWNGGDNGQPTNVYRITTPWVPAEATWSSASMGNPWTNPGGDYVGTTGIQAMDPYASNMLGINMAGSTGDMGQGGIFALTFNVTELVNEWYTGVNQNMGLLLEAPTKNELHFRGDKGSDPSLFPGLTITYHP
jgi:hypothetical protein